MRAEPVKPHGRGQQQKVSSEEEAGRGSPSLSVAFTWSRLSYKMGAGRSDSQVAEVLGMDLVYVDWTCVKCRVDIEVAGG